MALVIKKTYTDKQGEVITLKYPQIKIMGKLMDDGETHTFEVLKEAQKKQNTTFDYFSMFVKVPDTEKCYVLEFGTQVMGVLRELNPQPKDIITFTKGKVDDLKTGGSRPIVKASIDGRINKKEVASSVTSEEIDKFVVSYKEQIPPSDWSANHFVGAFMRKFSTKAVEPLVKTFDEKVK